jgi:hypothetical protein
MSRSLPHVSSGRASVRSLAALCGCLLAFLLVSFLALGVHAQAPPGHQHAWDAADPIPTPSVEAGRATVPAGDWCW